MFDVAHRGINGECCSHLQVCEFVSMSHVNFRAFFFWFCMNVMQHFVSCVSE